MYNPFVRSSTKDVTATRVRHSLTKFGKDLSLARRKRRLTVAMMQERIGVSKGTWLRMEKGDPSVAFGAYAQALFALGFGTPFDVLIDQSVDDQGLLLSAEDVPKRVGSPRKGKQA